MILRNKINSIIIDLDGVITKDKELNCFSDVKQWVAFVNDYYSSYIIATNNSRYSAEEISIALQNQNVAISKSKIITPYSYLTAYLNKMRFRNVFVMGDKKFKDRLRRDNYNPEHSFDSIPEAIVIGMTGEYNHSDIEKIGSAIVRYNPVIIGMNDVMTVKVADDRYMPGAGSLINLFSGMRNDTETITFGKTSRTIMKDITDKLGNNVENILMVSDDPFQDLDSYKAKGYNTAFITTGKYDLDCLDRVKTKPDFVVSSLTELSEKLKNI